MPSAKPSKSIPSKAQKSIKETIVNNHLDAEKATIRTWLGGISLECPAPTPAEALATGERQVEFRVQQQVRPALQHDVFVQVLRLTVHITWGANLLLILESDLCAEHLVSPNSTMLAETAEALYQAHRPTLQMLLAAAGHQPPLPSTLSEVKFQ